MKIALGIFRLTPRGGLEDNCIRIAEDLRQRGHEVTIFVAGAHPNLPIPTVSLTPRVDPPFVHLRVALFARNFIAATKGKFDRTLAFQPMPGADILFSADWIRDLPDISAWRRLTPRFQTYARLERLCYAADARTRIIMVSQPQIDACIDRYGTGADRIALVPPTLSREKRQPQLRTKAVRSRIRAEFGLSPDASLWLWLGVQPAVKGLDRVLDALQAHPQTHLMIAGLSAGQRKIGPYASRASRRNVDGRVHWLGYLSDNRLMDCIAAADALAHPARVDVTGGAILEALVNGLPVVATSVCGFAGHVRQSGAGRVIDEPFDPAMFSAALADVCGPQNTDYSAKGIAYGAMPDLYSGISAACNLIEAETWRAKAEA